MVAQCDEPAAGRGDAVSECAGGGRPPSRVFGSCNEIDALAPELRSSSRRNPGSRRTTVRESGRVAYRIVRRMGSEPRTAQAIADGVAHTTRDPRDAQGFANIAELLRGGLPCGTATRRVQCWHGPYVGAATRARVRSGSSRRCPIPSRRASPRAARHYPSLEKEEAAHRVWTLGLHAAERNRVERGEVLPYDFRPSGPTRTMRPVKIAQPSGNLCGRLGAGVSPGRSSTCPSETRAQRTLFDCISRPTRRSSP